MNYENAISIKNVSKNYKDFCLQNISLELKKGTVMGFVGQNGSGKTSTIKAVLNLIKTDDGNISVFNLDNKQYSTEIKEEIGIVFDELALPDVLTCKMVNSIMKNIYKNWDEKIFFHYTDVFSLPLNKPFKKFSRGMQMKIQMAIALSHKAKLLILDEATAGLDPIARNNLLDILLEYMESEEHSILISSHITSDLERIADYVTFIDNGRILLSDEKYVITENHCIVKGPLETIYSLPKECIVSTRKNSYGAEALTDHPDRLKHDFPDLIYDKASLDDILCFYVKKIRFCRRKNKRTGEAQKMIGIIKKDLLTTRFYATIYFLCSLCYIGTYFYIKTVVFRSEIRDTDFSRTTLSILPLILIMEFNCKSFHYDRLGTHFEKYMNALPLSPRKIVLSKFISSTVFSAYGLMISLLCMTFFIKTEHLSFSASSYTYIWISWFMILITLFLEMPILLYNGNELLSLLVPFVCISLSFGILIAFHNMDINAALLSVSGFFSKHTAVRENLPLLMASAALIAGMISYYISLQVYKRREF